MSAEVNCKTTRNTTRPCFILQMRRNGVLKDPAIAAWAICSPSNSIRAEDLEADFDIPMDKGMSYTHCLCTIHTLPE